MVLYDSYCNFFPSVINLQLLFQAFAQFDAEGDEVVDLESMLEAIKASGGANLQGELSHVIRQLQSCSLTPGNMDT